MTTTSLAPPQGLHRLGWGLRDAWVLALRLLRAIRHTPEQLSDVTIQPIMFVLLFAEVFGSAIAIPGGGSYHEFLLPGILVQSAVFGSISASVGMATDLQDGFIDRLISLPISRSAALGGRVIADTVQAVFGMLVTGAVGFAVGWRIHRGVLPTVGGLGLLLLFTVAMVWMGLLIGLLIRTPEAAPGILFPIIFPLTFLANAFVPTGGLPGWLRAVAEWNPVSALVAAVRQLFGNPGSAADAWPLRHAVPVAYGWAIVLVVLFAALALPRWRAITRR